MLNKSKQSKKSHAGFTLVEIMIVIAIIALLAAIAVPNFLRARKRSQATSIMNDLRQLDAAMDQYAIDTGKLGGFQPTFADLQNYLKTDTNLYTTGTDLFGNSYGPFTVDSVPQVPDSAFNTLSDVADANFWGQYYGNSGSGSGSDSGSGSGASATPAPSPSGVSPQQLAADEASLQSAQNNFNTIQAEYNQAMAENIGGQPRKDITAQYEAAQAALTQAQAAVAADTSGSGT